MVMNHNVDEKFLSVKILKQLLKELPKDVVLRPNTVGNISVFKIEKNNLEYLGFIDFLGKGEIFI